MRTPRDGAAEAAIPPARTRPGRVGWDGLPRRPRDGSVVRHSAGRRPSTRLLGTLLALALIGTAGGLAGWAHSTGRLDLGLLVGPAAGPTPPAGASPAASPPSDPTPSPSSPGRPAQIRIPRIGVTSSLIDLRLDSAGVMSTPTDYAVAGWYADGTVPGEIGPAVIAGHVDSTSGPAVFFRLTELAVGDVVEVGFGSRVVTFTVTRAGRYPKASFPTADVYGPTPDAQLRLITCGGVFDRARNSYQDNYVIYAVATT